MRDFIAQECTDCKVELSFDLCEVSTSSLSQFSIVKNRVQCNILKS